MRMKLRKLFLLTAILPLLLQGCGGGGNAVPELPPPVVTPGGDDNGNGNGNGNGGETPTGSNPWDENRGKVVTAAELYEAVWEEKFLSGSGNTVMVHVLNVRRKIEENPSKPKILRTVWGRGYQID